MRKQWNKNGPEGIQLARDIVQGVRDGALSLEAPQDMSMYNKNLGVYGSFSKDSFRSNAKAVAMGNSATSMYIVQMLLLRKDTNLLENVHAQLASLLLIDLITTSEHATASSFR
jgi:hypothetical protein